MDLGRQWPSIIRWSVGRDSIGSASSLEEYTSFVTQAVMNGSTPMIAIAAIAARDDTQVLRGVINSFCPKLKAKASRLLNLSAYSCPVSAQSAFLEVIHDVCA
jgi:hypothetical protein